MENSVSRRDVLKTSLPAALVGTLMGSGILMAQEGGSGFAGSPVSEALNAAYRDGQYLLPPLRYDYDALEPHIDAQTMQLHHDKHHQGYVNGLNKTLQQLADLRSKGGELDTTLLTALEENLTFNGSGHILHTVFWATMSPRSGGAPRNEIGQAIDRQFGSFNAFKAHFSKAAASVKGSGWGLLAYEPLGDNLMVLQVKQHDLQTIFGCVPLLPLDVWEHAYYLKYQNNRGQYIDAWWNVVNWPAVNATYVAARRIYGRQ